MKPPYGRITAIDLNRGEHSWMVPNGDGPRDHLLLKSLNLPPLGHASRGALLVTRTLLFAPDGDQINVRTPQGGGGGSFARSTRRRRHHLGDGDGSRRDRRTDDLYGTWGQTGVRSGSDHEYGSTQGTQFHGTLSRLVLMV